MNYYKTKPLMAGLKSYIETHYETYLDQIRASSETHDLPTIVSVEIGGDYEKKGKAKPWMILELDQILPEDQEVGRIEAGYSIDVAIAVDGYTEETAEEKVHLYTDAFLSMLWADQYLGCLVINTQVRVVDNFPGGTGNVKYILINLLLTVEEARS